MKPDHKLQIINYKLSLANLSSLISQADYGLLLALGLTLFAVMPLLTHAGLPNTADGPAHLMRQVELNQAWQEGNFYPRWGTDLAYGHGMPIFSYAPPALYQLTQIFHLFGLPLDAAMKGVLGLDFLLYSLGMFLLARRLFGPGPALVAAAMYVYAPYRLREAYIQGNYGQFTGLAFYPFIFWAFHGLITTKRPRYLVAAAFTLAGLLLSHNISFMLFAPMLAVYIVFLVSSQQFGIKQPSTGSGRLSLGPLSLSKRAALRSPLLPILHVLAASFLGLGLAAIFWLPAFGERHDIQLEGITRGFFDFRENFISPAEFFALPLPLDRGAINPAFPLSLGLPQLIGSAAGLLALAWIIFKWITRPSGHPPKNSSENKFTEAQKHSFCPPFSFLVSSRLGLSVSLPSSAFALFFACFLGLYTFLALPASQRLWEAVPLLELAEFPWRMLGPAIFCASLLSAYALSIIGNVGQVGSLSYRVPNFWNAPLSPAFGLLFSILLVITPNLFYLYPAQFIVWGTPDPADAFAYEVTSGAIGTTSTGEFLPRSTQQHPRPETLGPDYVANRLPQKIDPATLPSDATVKTVFRQAEADSFLITTPQPFTATLRTLYWPGWQLYLDNQPHPFIVTTPTGLIQTYLPAGQHHLTLQLESTPLRTIGLWLTLFSLVISLMIIAMTIKRRGDQNAAKPPAPFLPLPFFLTVVIGLVAVYLLSRPLEPWFTRQSNPDQPQPADTLLHVDFGHPQTPLLRLVGMDNLPDAVAASTLDEAELTATLYWHALSKLDTNYSVFLHLDAPNGQTAATVDQAHPDNIPTRNWPPGLYLRNTLRLKLPANLLPIRYDVTVGLYDQHTGERLSLWPDQTTTYKLGSIWLTPPRPNLPARPLARFGSHVTLWDGHYAPNTGILTLYWQTDRPFDRDYSIFIHLFDAKGNLIGQADGVPYNGLYPPRNWQPGQVVTDLRPLTAQLPNIAELRTIAIGLYDPAAQERLPAADAAGTPLPNNNFILPVTP